MAEADARTHKFLDCRVMMREHLRLRKEPNMGGLRTEQEEWQLGPAKCHGAPVPMRSNFADFASPAYPCTHVCSRASRTKQSPYSDAGASLLLIVGRTAKPRGELPPCRERNRDMETVDQVIIVAGLEAHRGPEGWRRSLLSVKVRAPL